MLVHITIDSSPVGHFLIKTKSMLNLHISSHQLGPSLKTSHQLNVSVVIAVAQQIPLSSVQLG